MWNKITILILTLQICAEISAKSIYRDNQNEQVPVNQHVYGTQQYGTELQDLGQYVQKLQEQGLIQPISYNTPPFVLLNNANEYGQSWYPTYHQLAPAAPVQAPAEPHSTDAPNFTFDELAIIQLIPIIIDQLRKNALTPHERDTLEKIYGNSLWSLLDAEASRADDAEMNPLLKTILNSEEVKLAKRDIAEHFGNDIYKNSLRRVYRGDSSSTGLKSPKPYISLDDDRKVLSPSERLLNMIAAIVHKSNVMEKSRQKAEREAKLKQKERLLRKRSKKLSGGNPLGIIKPRQRYVDRILSINRMKRSIIKFGTDLDDMRALLNQVNRDNDLLDEDEEPLAVPFADDDEDDDDYMDDDYDLFDFPSEPAVHQQMSIEDDFSFDSYPRHYRNTFDDYENGSVNEFIDLARQRDRREKKHFMDVMQHDEEYDENDYEAYDDN